ncbi:MAG TPA: hypothetical protein VGN12_03115 [Pirellulales bacterium]
MDQLSISCPGCAARIKYPPTKAGATIACPRCKAAITLPAAPPVDDFIASIQPEVAAAAVAPESPQRWDPEPVAYGQPTPLDDPGPSYWALRIIASILRVIGALSFLLALVIFAYSMFATAEAAAPIPGGRFAPPQRSVFVPLAPAAALVVVGVQLFAGAELIVLLVNIARGTWRQTQLLERLVVRR